MTQPLACTSRSGVHFSSQPWLVAAAVVGCRTCAGAAIRRLAGGYCGNCSKEDGKMIGIVYTWRVGALISWFTVSEVGKV